MRILLLIDGMATGALTGLGEPAPPVPLPSPDWTRLMLICGIKASHDGGVAVIDDGQP